MAHKMSVHAQDPSAGRVGVVLEALADASRQAGDYEHVDVAVAYASAEGVRLLDEQLSSGIWRAARKRFLVSLDFGFTQPTALTRLNELANAEVRTPNGRLVLGNAALHPPSAFHAKVFAFRAGDSNLATRNLTRGLTDRSLARAVNLKSLIVGSANLTASALTTGSEVVTKQVWTRSPGATSGWEYLMGAKPVLDWFEDTWNTADPLSDVLEDYRLQHRSMPEPQQIQEESTPATRTYLASPEEHVVTGQLAVQLAAAKSLWVDASSMIRNRGDRPGTQLNMRRGTRAFFGFATEDVPKNTTLGTVNIRVSGYSYVDRTLRFSDNSMDIINLPHPEENGLDTYQGSILVFNRDKVSYTGQAQFTLSVTDESGLTGLKEAASNSIELSMNGGRKYGLLF